MSGSKSSQSGARDAIGIGVSLAIAISWTANKSICWAMIHGACGWLYVLYWAMGYGR